MATLYKHRIYCLHGVAGQLTDNVGAADTTFYVQQAVLDDVTIAVGSQIQLNDGTNTSVPMTITAVNKGANTLTVDVAPGTAFIVNSGKASGASAVPPTSFVDVVRIPHWAYAWTETKAELTQCPELASHPIQAGSSLTVDIREPNEIIIHQGAPTRTHPTLTGQDISTRSGQTLSVDFVWDYDITILSIEGVFETANTGDNFDFLVGPDTSAGRISKAVSATDTVISVGNTVIAVARPAMLIKLNRGATTNDLGHIISVDKVAKTVTVSTAAVNAFTTAASVWLTTAWALAAFAPTIETVINVGNDYIGGNNITAGTIVRVVYRNVGPLAGRAIANVKYLT